ncbi:unnamed protein product [Kuraishia capsulata CBS 1993]|uniref:BZIP domain-containing protein n=1 Tax=Kuraishia capsulata CBS 1993 TaxID=1382522 RepID=W6MXJ5_9ASCO|nr:uncharacterized protein KUCA_T00004986001 [Kuraishia capsulata CBS 1993]CDK29000.1 unnamed protein product [Kuraishia capsulata CBS 1993]
MDYELMPNHAATDSMWDGYLKLSDQTQGLFGDEHRVADNIDECIKKEFDVAIGNPETRAESVDGRNGHRETSSDSSMTLPHASEEEIYQRRKAQNRASQRAFRERKEIKLKELSAKLAKSETERQQLMRELEALKQANLILGTENQILQKTSSKETDVGGPGRSPSPSASSVIDIATTDPVAQTQKFNFPRDKYQFIGELVADPNDEGQGKSETYVAEGQKLLTVGAVWDYINQLIRDNEEVDVDVHRVMMLLKGNEKCHGHGAAYPLALVNEAVKACIS